MPFFVAPALTRLPSPLRLTATTEKVYRRQIRPVIRTGATTIDRIFDA